MTLVERVRSVAEGEKRLEQIAQEMIRVTHSKSFTGSELKTKMDQLEAEYDAVEGGLKSYKRSLQFRAGSEIGQPPPPAPEGALVSAKQLNPLSFDYADLKMCHEAMSRGQNFQIRAKAGRSWSDKSMGGDGVNVKTPGTFSSPVSALPPQLWPLVVHPEHENRILDRLPATQVASPSLEFIQHTGSTGTPLVVAEGTTKPEITFQTSKVVIPMLKIAAHIAITWESIADTSGDGGLQDWFGYVQGELFREVQDYENLQLLSGVGGASAIQGLLNQSGILTHDASHDTGTGITALDSFEMAIAQMRTGAALAEPNLIVMHPFTWSNLRRVKDAYSRFLVAPDPTQDEARTLWGVPVLTTIAAQQGTAVMIDTTKFGFATIREALTMRVGYDSGDFTANMQRIVVEERLNLAIVRPTAVLRMANLPYVGGS